jgi:hypothetical protein
MLADTVGASTRAPTLELVHLHVGVAQAEEMARARIADVQRLDLAPLRSSEKKCVGRFGGPARLRDEHIEPLRASPRGAEPGMRHAERHDAAGARRQRTGVAVENEDRLAFENVKAFFERMHVGVDPAAGVKRAQAERRMHRAMRTVDQRAAAEARAVARVGRRQPDRVAAQDVVHVCSSARARLSCLCSV